MYDLQGLAAETKLSLQVGQGHVRVCDNCVEDFDHHCSFLDSCIGKYNYNYFIGFLSSIALLSISEIAGFLIYLFGIIGRKADLTNDYCRHD